MNTRMHKDSEQSSDCMIIDMVRGVRKAAACSEGWEPWGMQALATRAGHMSSKQND